MLSTVEDAELELLEVEEGVLMAVLFKGVLDELAIAVSEVVCEELMDSVLSLMIVVVAVAVVLNDEDDALGEPKPKPSTVPTE